MKKFLFTGLTRSAVLGTFLMIVTLTQKSNANLNNTILQQALAQVISPGPIVTPNLPEITFPVILSPDSNQQLNTEDYHLFITWASRHRSFPQVSPQKQDSLGCFMQTEDGRILNLQAICGNPSQTQLENTQKSTHTP